MTGDRGRAARARLTEQSPQYARAVEDFQRSAFWNLRTSIANFSIVIGFFAAFAVAVGGAGGWRLPPSLTCVVAGILGACVYAMRGRPSAVKWLLIAAVSLSALGILGLVVAVRVYGR
ncbi:MAG TPA: hypothetical protein VF657_23770 [Actinoplanes sp.]